MEIVLEKNTVTFYLSCCSCNNTSYFNDAGMCVQNEAVFLYDIIIDIQKIFILDQNNMGGPEMARRLAVAYVDSRFQYLCIPRSLKHCRRTHTGIFLARVLPVFCLLISSFNGLLYSVLKDV